MPLAKAMHKAKRASVFCAAMLRVFVNNFMLLSLSIAKTCGKENNPEMLRNYYDRAKFLPLFAKMLTERRPDINNFHRLLFYHLAQDMGFEGIGLAQFLLSRGKILAGFLV